MKDRQKAIEKAVKTLIQVKIFEGLTIIDNGLTVYISEKSVRQTFVQQYKFFERNMIQQPKNNVKWTCDQWVSSQSGRHYQKLTGKKWTKNLEEVDTDATASWSETIDQNLSDVEPTISRVFTIEIMGKTFTVNCLDVEDVKSLLQKVGGLEDLRQRQNEIKMVILESLCRENKLLVPFLDRQCKQYSRKKVKQLFL